MRRMFAMLVMLVCCGTGLWASGPRMSVYAGADYQFGGEERKLYDKTTIGEFGFELAYPDITSRMGIIADSWFVPSSPFFEFGAAGLLSYTLFPGDEDSFSLAAGGFVSSMEGEETLYGLETLVSYAYPVAGSWWVSYNMLLRYYLKAYKSAENGAFVYGANIGLGYRF